MEQRIGAATLLNRRTKMPAIRIRKKDKRWPKPETIKHCRYCEVKFATTRFWMLFCSDICKEKARQARRKKGTFQPAQIYEGNCEQCGYSFKQWLRHYKNRKPKYCSMKCAYLSRRGERSRFFRDGKYPHASLWKDQAARVRERDGYQCQVCHADGKRMPVDHAVPLRLLVKWGVSCTDGMLATLCRICHGKKFGPEQKLFRGDVLGFVTGLKAMNYPENIFRVAMDSCGLGLAVRKPEEICQLVKSLLRKPTAQHSGFGNMATLSRT